MQMSGVVAVMSSDGIVLEIRDLGDKLVNVRAGTVLPVEDNKPSLAAGQYHGEPVFVVSRDKVVRDWPVLKQPPVVVFDGADFLARFTNAEYGAILSASLVMPPTKQSIQIAIWLDTFRLRGEIDVTGSTALAAKAGLVKAGLLTPDRADVIFATG